MIFSETKQIGSISQIQQLARVCKEKNKILFITSEILSEWPISEVVPDGCVCRTTLSQDQIRKIQEHQVKLEIFVWRLLIFVGQIHVILCPRSVASRGHELDYLSLFSNQNVEFSLGTDDTLLADVDLFRELEFFTRHLLQKNKGKLSCPISPGFFFWLRNGEDIN